MRQMSCTFVLNRIPPAASAGGFKYDISCRRCHAIAHASTVCPSAMNHANMPIPAAWRQDGDSIILRKACLEKIQFFIYRIKNIMFLSESYPLCGRMEYFFHFSNAVIFSLTTNSEQRDVPDNKVGMYHAPYETVRAAVGTGNR